MKGVLSSTGQWSRISEKVAKFSFIIILLFYKKYLIDIFLLIEIYLPIVSILAVDRFSSIIHCNSIYVKYSIFYVNIKFSIS